MKALSQYPRFSVNDTRVKVITNRVDTDEAGQQLFNKLNSVVARYLKIPMSYLGSIPQDPLLQKSVMQQTPVSLAYENAKSVRSFENITAQLTGTQATDGVKTRGMAAFFSYIITGRKLSEKQNER